jgi:hypothetical protein
MWTPPLHVNLKCGASNQSALPRDPNQAFREISNLFKEEHQSGSRDAVDVDWTKT